MKKLFFLAFLALLFCGCSHHDLPLAEHGDTMVYFRYDSATTKTLQVNDTQISNCNIMMYDAQGQLVASSYCPTGKVTTMSLTSAIGRSYKFYCVCNIGDITGNPLFRNVTGLEGYQYTVNSYSDIVDITGAVPMTGCTGFITIAAGMNIVIDLTRCVALVSIRIDDSELENSDISINSIRVRNAASKVGLFGHSAATSAQDCTPNGDYAAPAELSTFNNGDPVGFYMFENKQGELLPGNTSCTTKFFEEGSIYEQLCSYVELEGYYNDLLSDNPRRGNFTYRFYLGENTTTDFSVVRNHHYHIVLKLHDNGVDEESWRVDDELLPYATLVRVIPPEYTFVGVSGTTTLTAEVLPAGADQSVIWSSGNPSVATVDQNGMVTPHSLGTAEIRATVTDGSGVFGTGIIHVVQPSVPVSIEPNYLKEFGWVLGAGSFTRNFEVTVHYQDGSSRVLSGQDALATIDNSDGEWIIDEEGLQAPFETTAMELLLNYTESGRTVSFSSEGEVVKSDDFYTATFYQNVNKKYGDTDHRPIVVTNIQCYRSPVCDLEPMLTFTTNSSFLERTADGYRLIGTCTVNGDIHYTLAGSLIDGFGNRFSKTYTKMITVFEYRKRFYNIQINTMVRDYINPNSQEQPDNIIVTITLVKSWESSQQIARYFFPASYDQDTGELVQGSFTYRWYQTTMTVQMQDDREYEYNYDNNGNLLIEGYCFDESRYIYYDSL